MSQPCRDRELAAVMRKLLTTPGPEGYAAIDVLDGTFDIDVTGVQLTEEEQLAIEEVWE